MVGVGKWIWTARRPQYEVLRSTHCLKIARLEHDINYCLATVVLKGVASLFRLPFALLVNQHQFLEDVLVGYIDTWI